MGVISLMGKDAVEKALRKERVSDINNLRFEFGILPTFEEENEYLKFLERISGKEFKKSEKEDLDSWLGVDGDCEPLNAPGIKRGILFAEFDSYQRELIYQYEAFSLLEQAERYDLPILIADRCTGNLLEVQAKVLNYMKEELGTDARKFLFCLSFDTILGYPELVLPPVADWRKEDIELLANDRLETGLWELKNVLKHIEIDMVIMGNDICWGHGPMRTVQELDWYVFPYLEKQVKALRDLGIKYIIKHTDGNVLKDGILQKFIDCGIDGFHPADPLEMDIRQVRDYVRGRVCILGGLNCTALPWKAGEGEYEDLVRYTLMEGFKSSFIPGASNKVQKKDRIRFEQSLKIQRELGAGKW